MRVFIAVDMEGISGVTLPEQVRKGEPPYQDARRHMTLDVNACVEGCLAGGAGDVVVWDAHGDGFNVLWEEIHPKAVLQQGRGPAGRMADIGEFDALILLGYHAMAGTTDAVLDHTMSSVAWQNFWINGRKAGEFAIDAGIAGDEGVPCIMVSGDDKVCREAEEWIPGIFKAEVKKAVSCFGARFLSPAEARRKIAETAETACRNHKNIPPLMHEKPVRMKLELTERHSAPPETPDKPWLKRLDARTYEVTGAATREALRRLQG